MNSVMLSLREAIVQRVQDKSQSELQEIIRDSIDGDEKALPGLGVLFEMIWKNSDDSQQQHMLETLHKQLT
ncbi:small acid-soluble spore protein SspI [Marinicrinis sediminis]|uniref:Small, acid-soluble spore protein I n=1 Tax=Marinicrinis sediminis TaxID=1652465 RepID=A0ABW5RBW4_9BACL